MKVLYDYQGFMQRHGGVSRYFVELIQAMKALGDFEAIIPSFFTDNQYLQKKRTFVTRQHFKGKIRLMSMLNRTISQRSLRSDYDLFHPTYFQPYFFSRLKTPFIVTVHDMTHDLFGADYVRDDGTRLNIRALCKKAKRIIAVSHATKSDVCELLDIPEERITVVHHGTNLRYNNGECLHPGRYVLYVGEREGYKNFGFLLSAITDLLIKEGLDLLCIGSRPFSKSENGLIARLGVSQHVRHVQVSTANELASLYHFASGFIYPSLHEGFGMPLLEAFACGCPVIASAIPSFREVAGEAAEYFDPGDASSILSAVRRVVFESLRAAELTRLGYERLKSFSWEKAARSTLAVYRSAI